MSQCHVSTGTLERYKLLYIISTYLSLLSNPSLPLRENLAGHAGFDSPHSLPCLTCKIRRRLLRRNRVARLLVPNRRPPGHPSFGMIVSTVKTYSSRHAIHPDSCIGTYQRRLRVLSSKFLAPFSTSLSGSATFSAYLSRPTRVSKDPQIHLPFDLMVTMRQTFANYSKCCYHCTTTCSFLGESIAYAF
jgi:hypothetical protein